MSHPRFNRHFSRRAFLNGLGVAAAVSPFIPLLNLSAAEARPRRLVLFFTPHGTVLDAWKPKGTETDFTLGPILAPLERHKSKLLLLGGIEMISKGVGAPHTKGLPLLWTGSTLLEEKTFERADGSGGRYFGWNSGPSVDQVIAEALGAKTPYKSLEFGLRSGGSNPASRMIYAGARQPLPPEINPYSMFDRLFAVNGDQLRSERRSAIDLVSAELEALRVKAAPEDRPKLDAHLTAVRGIEARLDVKLPACTAPTIMAPGTSKLDPGAVDNTPTVLTQQMDMLVAALTCDITRVASLQYTLGDNDNALYSWLNITNQGHHTTTHAGDTDTDARANLIKIYTWYADRFAYLLDQMAAVRETDGTSLLDNSLVVWGSELGKGNVHSFNPTPFVVAGGAGGAIRPGRFLDFGRVQHNRLLVTICNAMGMGQIQTFGNLDVGNGPLPGVLT